MDYKELLQNSGTYYDVNKLHSILEQHFIGQNDIHIIVKHLKCALNGIENSKIFKSCIKKKL